jgi:hypothetical protein
MTSTLGIKKGYIMASGDASKAWFPEMLEELKSKWKKTMKWDSVILLCKEMTELRKKIKEEKGIKPLKMKCGSCNGYMELAPISVRSLLFALKKIGKVKEDTFKQLDKDWMSYQRKNNLDGYGKTKIKKS